MDKKTNLNKISIISGASGEIGTAFKDYFLKNGETVYGFSRQNFYGLYQLDVTDKESVNLFFKQHEKEISEAEQINFVHSMGLYKTEMDMLTGEQVIENPRMDNGIDEEVYRSAVESFSNVLEGICNVKKDSQKLFVTTIGALSNKYDIKYFYSSRESMNLIRDKVKELIKKDKNVFGRMLNVSSIFTKKEFEERPFTPKKDVELWLKLDQIMSLIDEKKLYTPQDSSYLEIDVFNKKEGFNPSEYYSNENIYETRVLQRTGKTPDELRASYSEFSNQLSVELRDAQVNYSEVNKVPYHDEQVISEINKIKLK